MDQTGAGRTYRMGNQGGGEVLADACDGLPVAVWRNEVLPGGGPGPHLHRDWAEAFYVLEGTFRFRVGDQEVQAGAGDFVLAGKGQPHGFTNTGDVPGRLLCVAPAQSLAEVEALAELVTASGGRPDPTAIQELFERSNSSLVAPRS